MRDLLIHSDLCGMTAPDENVDLQSLPDEEVYPMPVNTIREIEYPHMKEGD